MTKNNGEEGQQCVLCIKVLALGNCGKRICSWDCTNTEQYKKENEIIWKRIILINNVPIWTLYINGTQSLNVKQLIFSFSKKKELSKMNS